MRTIPSRAASKRKQDFLFLEQGLISLILGIGMSFLGVIIIYSAFVLLYMGRVYPGVMILGTNVGGLSVEDAAEKVADLVTYPRQGRVIIFYEDQNWVVTPQEIGLIYDSEATAHNSYQVGRHGGIFQRFEDQIRVVLYGQVTSPVLVFERSIAAQMLERLAQEIDRPLINASITLNGTEVNVYNSQSGRKVDIESTLGLLERQMISMQDGTVQLAIDEEQPSIADVTRQAETVKAILSQPLVMTLPDGQPDKASTGPWVVDPITLSTMLFFDTVQTAEGFEYRISIKPEVLSSFLTGQAYSLEISPSNARFVFNDDTHQLEVIQPAVIGRALNIVASLENIQQKLLQGEHTMPIEFIFSPPAVTDEMNGEQLGIRELVQSETSYFYGSSSTRVQNIITAASKFHGLLVAPGETFSMSQAMGEVSLDNGYAEALIIYGGQTIKGVGGGVCQVSTTLFRTAFFSGFPIIERHPHAYRVYYYEQSAGNYFDESLAGLDATVYVPVVDFKFTNDTPSWLLMETYVSPTYSTIEWKFYSTKDGRTVEWDTSGPTNIIEAPKPEYHENPDLPQGEVKQVDWAADGADVTVKRTVLRNGEILSEDTIYTKYEPWKAVYEYGPGTEGMPPPEDTENIE